MIPRSAPRPFAPLLGLERQRLLALLGELSPAQWELPTPCPGWTVLDLARHLVGDDLSWISWARDDHRGAPPDAVDEAGFIRWLDALQVQWVDATQRLSAPLVVDLLGLLDPICVQVMSAQDPTERTAHVSWASDDPTPVWLDQARELSERWLHRQQLLDTLGRPSDLRADLLVPVVGGLRWAYPFRLAELSRPEGTTVVIDVTDADTGGDAASWQWRLVRRGDGWSFEDGDPLETAGPAARLRVSADQAWRLLSNNLRPEHGDVGAAGDAEVIDVLLRTRAIIGTPGPLPRVSPL